MHSLIIGMTESGKSTLAKILSKRLQSVGKRVVVLDPLMDSGWGAEFQTDDIDTLKAYMEENRSAYVFVDESGQWFNEGNDLTNAWLATRSRHYGHSVFFVAQRATQVPKTMRDQTSRLFLFTSSRTDGILHSEEWNKDEIRLCNMLPALHFYNCSRYGTVSTMRIVDYKDITSVDGGFDSVRDVTTGSGKSRLTNGTVGKGKGKRRS